MWIYPQRRRYDDNLTPTDDRSHATARLLTAYPQELSGCRLYLSSVSFFYVKLLGWDTFDLALVVPKRQQCIPVLDERSQDRHRCKICGHLLACRTEADELSRLTHPGETDEMLDKLVA
jgi:hypothetical protein